MRVADYMQALPDSYQKTEQSNNYKLLQMEQSLVDDLRTDIDAVQATLDVYTATGKTLDLYGSIYGQQRGSLTDEQYRAVIVQSATRCLVGGDSSSIINALAIVFNVPASSFVLAETDNPCEVELTDVPYSVLQNYGFTGGQLYQIVASMLPSGVRLAPLTLDGTFAFADTADEYDANAGFGDIDQTIGGYLGWLSTDDISIPT